MKMPGAGDYDYDDGVMPAEGAGGVPKFDQIPEDQQHIPKPDNMTEEQWKHHQYLQFQKAQYDQWQKAEYERWEKHRFFQYQLAKFNERQAERQKKIQEEHAKFVEEQQKEMQSEQEKHHNWLQGVLTGKEQREFMKMMEEDGDEL